MEELKSTDDEVALDGGGGKGCDSERVRNGQWG